MENSFAFSSAPEAQVQDASGVNTGRSVFDITKLIKLPQFAGTMELGPSDVKSFCVVLETKFPILILEDAQTESKKCQVTVACLT